MVMALRLGHLLSRLHRTAAQIHQSAIWRRMRKHHAAAAPITGWMRPGARRRRAHAALLRQGQGNTPLLQGGGAAAVRQSGMEGGERRRLAWPRWGGLTRR